MSDSSTGGYLAPDPDPDGPLYDYALEDFFQGVIVGITGLPGSMVRPRWPVTPANMPSADTNWVAFGVTLGDRQWNAFQKFDAKRGPNGSYIVEGVEALQVKASFYGPDNFALQRRFENGLQLAQNREVLGTQNINFLDFGVPVNVPALFKERWVLRSDVLVSFNRWATRVYPVQTILSADVTLNNEKYVESISVTPPTP